MTNFLAAHMLWVEAKLNYFVGVQFVIPLFSAGLGE